MSTSRPLRLLRCAVALALCGCQSGPAIKPVTEAHFFPQRPDLPRVQFLRSFNGSRDFEERSSFLDYVAGVDKSSAYALAKPFSVASWKGRIYVTDSFGLQGLSVFDLEKRRFYVLGKAGGPGELKKAISVFVDGAGYKYVADRALQKVVVFGPDDGYQRSYGENLSILPISCVAHGNEVYVLDAANDTIDAEAAGETLRSGEELTVRRDQILVLDKATGKPLRRIGRHGSGQDGFSYASFLAVDRLGRLYVSDAMNHRVLKLNAQGEVLCEFGRHGDRAGDFAYMKGIAVDREGIIYVVDTGFQAVQAFDNAGIPLFAFGGPRAPEGAMDMPAGIWIDYDSIPYLQDSVAPDFKAEYLIIVANQLVANDPSRQNRVAIYAFGRRQGVDYTTEDTIARLDASSGAKSLWKLPVLPPTPGTPARVTKKESAPKQAPVKAGAPAAKKKEPAPGTPVKKQAPPSGGAAPQRAASDATPLEKK